MKFALNWVGRNMAAKVKRKKEILVKAKKKECIARAKVGKGNGIIRINGKLINAFTSNPILIEMLNEPLLLSGDIINDLNIDVNVSGGGVMGQIIASRGVIAKAIVKHSKNQKLKEKMLAYDRLLLVDDPRRVEPKKPLGRKARTAKQKSFR